MTDYDNGINAGFIFVYLIICPCKLAIMTQLPFTFNIIVVADEMHYHKQDTFVNECHIFLD